MSTHEYKKMANSVGYLHFIYVYGLSGYVAWAHRTHYILLDNKNFIGQ